MSGNSERDRRREEVAGQLSQALGVAAGLMTERIQAASTVRQARLTDEITSAPRARHRRPRGPKNRPDSGPNRPQGRRLHGWLMPLAAAAAVTAVVVGSVVVSRVDLGASQPSAPTGVPAFYLTMSSNSPDIDVRSSSDGAITGTFNPSRAWAIEAISAAADNRTFIVAESAVGSNGTGTCPVDRFLRFTVTSAGAIAGVRQVGAHVTGMMGGSTGPIAVSPDGRRLAYFTICTTLANPSPVPAVHVMNLASGAITTWTNAVTTATPADVTGPDSLAWTADGRSLSVNYQWKTSAANDAYQAVLLLNTDSGNGTLQAHGRVIWHQDNNCSPCVYDALISPDGTSLIGSTSTYTGHLSRQQGLTYDESLVRISLPDDRITGVLFRVSTSTKMLGIPWLPLWSDSSGTYWIVQDGTSLGWVSDGTFHRMQAIGRVFLAAW